MSNQSELHQDVRVLSGTASNHNSDWHAWFTVELIGDGPFNARMLAWINQRLVASHTNLPAAQIALAQAQGFQKFSDMNNMEFGGG